MTALPLAPAPVLSRLRSARRDRTLSAMGPMPWLMATGRLERVLKAWANGHLAEVPVGVGFDVLNVPAGLGREAVRRLHRDGHRVGPVLFGPLGAEFIIERGSAAGWSAPLSLVLRTGALVLLPPPGDETRTVGARSWLIPPCHPGTGAPLHPELTRGGTLLKPYQAAVRAAQERGEWPCAR
ncbi:hypothetical protein ABZX40_29130 [Streptomyces sp. NPDC004610]|uniref:hypothetical protein n=1 Tax=unclassified Streptomyces TaxID=2593676 RepID=UPI0033A3BB2F